MASREAVRDWVCNNNFGVFELRKNFKDGKFVKNRPPIKNYNLTSDYEYDCQTLAKLDKVLESIEASTKPPINTGQIGFTRSMFAELIIYMLRERYFISENTLNLTRKEKLDVT